MSAHIVVALALGGEAPAAIALTSDNDDSPHDDLVSVRGRVTAFVYDDENETDDELTMKEEGRPPWAGGPKALGIDPWPMSV
jgi:hypothetical protein